MGSITESPVEHSCAAVLRSSPLVQSASLKGSLFELSCEAFLWGSLLEQFCEHSCGAVFFTSPVEHSEALSCRTVFWSSPLKKY